MSKLPAFEPLSRHLIETSEPPGGSLGRAWRCVCDRPVFFRNSLCLFCGTQLGYDADAARIVPIALAGLEGVWREAQDGTAAGRWRRCANFDTPAGCNWLVPWTDDGTAHGPGAGPRTPAPPPAGPQTSSEAPATTQPTGGTQPAARPQASARPPTESPSQAPTPAPAEATTSSETLCTACRLNRTIPDLSQDDNVLLWQRLEIAKRRLVSQLVQLRLPVASKTDDPERGLAFDLLRSPPGGPKVMTGHASGLITLDIEEADDARREAVRTAMGEPYRTLLGHFRHEIGHYYWDRLVQGGPWHEPFRELFGDERADYAAAIEANAREGPREGWEGTHVSSYASVHPWEDWAETFAHYLHMVDVVQTAIGFGLEGAGESMNATPFGREVLWRPEAPDADAFLRFVNAWVGLTCVFNEMTRSMGQPDFYPFVLPGTAVAKLQFIHAVVSG